MSTVALPRLLRRALHVTILTGAVGLAVVACRPLEAPPSSGPATLTTTSDPTATGGATTTTLDPTATSGSIAASTGGAAATGTATTTVIATSVSPATSTTLVAATTAAPSTTTAPAGDGLEERAARAVFDATNAFRSENGVGPLVWNDALQRSAHQHDLAMAADNQMAHQLPGEPSFDTRITDQGVDWITVAENIGYNTDQTVAGALALHTMMINEIAPNDDHRVNKLNPSSTALGVSVLIDPGTGKLWLTEDYAQL